MRRRRLRDAGCDLICMGTIVKDTIIILQTARKMGWNVDFCGQFATYSTAVAEAPGEPAEGFYSMSPALYRYPDDPRPAVRAFARRYKQRFGIELNYLGEAGYTAAQLLARRTGEGGTRPDVDSFIAGDGEHEGLARHLRRAAVVDHPDQSSRLEPVVPVGGEEDALVAGGDGASGLQLTTGCAALVRPRRLRALIGRQAQRLTVI